MRTAGGWTISGQRTDRSPFNAAHHVDSSFDATLTPLPRPLLTTLFIMLSYDVDSCDDCSLHSSMTVSPSARCCRRSATHDCPPLCPRPPIHFHFSSCTLSSTTLLFHTSINERVHVNGA